MSKVRYTQSLRARIMTVMGILFLALTVLIVASILIFVYATEQNAWRARQTEAAENAAVRVNYYLEHNEALLFWLDKYDFKDVYNKPVIFQEILKDNPSFMEVTFVDMEGNPIIDAARNKPTLANQFTILQSEWFRVASSGKKIYSRVQTSPQDESYIILAIPSQHGGVLAAQIQMDDLWETVADIHFGAAGRIYIVNQSGQVIAHPNRQIVLSNQNIGDTIQFKEILQSPNHKWIGDAVNFDGVKVVSVSTPIELIDWVVISELPQQEAYAVSRRASLLIPLGILILVTTVTLIFREMLIRLIMQPLNLLRQGAYQIGRGNLTHQIEIPRRDELGEVMAVFNSMASSLDKQQDNLQKALAYEYETKRANELARSNSMILALSKVAALLENSANSELIMNDLGSEMQKLGLNCAVVTIDQSQEAAVIKYLSYNPAVVQKIEKIIGFSLKNYVVPRRYWPGDRILNEKNPIWYPKPREFIRRMFPSMPDVIANQAWKFLGIQAEGQLCILPLLIDNQIIGAMPIWGLDLRSEDSPILAIFAGQVAGILQNAFAYERETERANELTRSNSMILAFSKVAAKLDSSSDTAEIFDAIGKELKALGIESVVGVLDDNKQELRIKYVSIKQEVIRWAEKMTGHSFSELSIPRRLWLTEKVVTENVIYWDPNFMGGTIDMFPILPKRLHVAALKMAGINENDPVCYLPLAHEQDVIGVLAVWGPGLERNDISAISVFASQVATAIRNSQLYEIEIRRGNEKEVLLKEIHHRVKNNLQIISSLLNLQTDQIKDTGTLRILRDSQARVRSMALIHEKLYQSNNLAKIEFGEYVQSLSQDLFRSYQRSLGDIQLKVEVDEISLDLDYAIPCGLILNELITNALKYAFPNERNGTLRVELRAGPNQILTLKVADDGIGLPADADIFNSNSLGLQLVNSLVRQVNGKLEVKNETGTVFQISFKY